MDISSIITGGPIISAWRIPVKVLRLALVVVVTSGLALSAQGRRGGGAALPPLNLPPDSPKLTELKAEAMAEVDKAKDTAQVWNDQIFSFAELGFQEFETQKF